MQQLTPGLMGNRCPLLSGGLAGRKMLGTPLPLPPFGSSASAFSSAQATSFGECGVDVCSSAGC